MRKAHPRSIQKRLDNHNIRSYVADDGAHEATITINMADAYKNEMANAVKNMMARKGYEKFKEERGGKYYVYK